MTGLVLTTGVAVTVGCATPSSRPGSESADSAKWVEVVLVQVNDLYEITAMQGGHRGGLARVATLKKEMQAKNPNTYLVLAGDFLSPSAIGTAKVDGRELKGRQMVATLAAMGLDLTVFGNHEFDLKQHELDARIQEGREQFLWLAGNVRDRSGKPYAGLPISHIQEFKSSTGASVKVGFVTTTNDSTKPAHVDYVEPIQFLKSEAARLRPQVDIVVAVTHLPLADDTRVAEEIPEIDLIIGGHDHESMLHRRGKKLIPIAKADSNAKTAYIHVLKFDPRSGRVVIDSALRQMDESISEDPHTKAVADSWMKAAFAGFRRAGFDPERVVGEAREPLHGAEAAVRNRETNLTVAIGKSLLREFKGADVAIFTGGGIRIDDDLPPGPITEYDVIRVMPFPDSVVGYVMSGGAIKRLLDEGKTKAGTGDFLHGIGIDDVDGRYFINGQPMREDREYRVATNTFLGNTLQSRFDAKLLYRGGEARRVFINFLRAEMPAGR